MINGAIRKALDLAKRKMQPQQGPSIQSPAPQIPRQKDMPVDPTRSKSSQERKKFQDGGQVMKHDKLNDALDIALSETHPKRFHHTLARTGYADGGLPDMDTSPADLANDVPYTRSSTLASPFNVAQAAPFKPKGIKLGATKIAPLKKRGIRAPRADLGKMRMKKARLAKPGKLKFAEGGHPEINDALRLASRTMSDMAKHIGDEGVHGASMQQGSTSTVVKEKVPGKKSEIVYEHHAKTPPEMETFASGGGAWTRKEGKNPEGGLNAKGRASLKAQGHDIRPPAPHPKTEKDAARRKSFCARMSGMPGPMKDDNGKPTRKALSLRAWNCRADGGRLMHQDIIDALRLAEDRQNYAAGGFGRQKGRTSVTSPTPMPSNLPTGLPMPVNPNDPNTKFTYKGGSGINPELERLYGTSMFVPPEVSGRRSSLNPFYQPDMKPTDTTPFQADLGRPGMMPTDATGKPMPSNLPTGLPMPVNPNDPNTQFTYKGGSGINPGLLALERERAAMYKAYENDPLKYEKGFISPAPPFQADLGRPDSNKIMYGPNGEIAYAPGYKGSGVNPELVAGYRPPIGSAPPALPPGLDYNTMPPSVRQMFEPRQPSRPAPPPPMMPPMASPRPSNPFTLDPVRWPMTPPVASPGPSNPAVNPVRPIPDFMFGAGQGQMPQPTPLEQLGQPYPMMPQPAAPMPQPVMPQPMRPQQTSPVFQPFANAGRQQPFFGGTGTKAGPSTGGLYRGR